jgi:hypothetical protein
MKFQEILCGGLKMLVSFGFLTLIHVDHALSQEFAAPCKGSEVRVWNDCFGRYTFQNGEVYSGNWKNGKREGQGTHSFPNGGNYIGEFRQDAWNGKGTLAQADGTLYEGTFVDGYLHGQGLSVQVDGTRYVGDFKEGRYSGWGNLSYPSGAFYVGQFRGGLRHGRGVHVHPDGKRYVGELNSEQASGEGVLYAADGQVLQSGRWVADQLVTQYELDQASFPFDFNKGTLLSQGSAKPQSEPRPESLTVDEVRPVSSSSYPLAENDLYERRLALVIGNAAYSSRPLANTLNDADDIATALARAGFDLINLRDASLSQMRSAVRDFGDRLRSYDVGLVYFSGHGIEIEGQNYFIPVGADIRREDEIVDQSLSMEFFLAKMSSAQRNVNIFIVDACRDNPFMSFSRSGSRGLANVEAPKGTLIAYSTAPGDVALDGKASERNSPYTRNLVRAINEKRLPIELVFKQVRRSVQQETAGAQTPWENTSLTGDFYFHSPKP